MPWDDHVTFGACCDFFETISTFGQKDKTGKRRKNTAQVRKARETKLANFLRDCRKVQGILALTLPTDMKGMLSAAACAGCLAHLNDYGGGDAKPSLYPVLRLLLPYLDRDRGAYGIKESVLADLYIDFLQLGKKSYDAQKLKNFRTPKNNSANQGDFAETLHSVIRDRSYGDSKMTVKEVNDFLDGIVTKNAEEGRKGVGRDLKTVFKKMNDVQQKWLVRIILKDNMRTGMGSTSIFRSFHPDAKGVYDVNANLRKVCELLNNPDKRMNEIEVELFSPFRPMLADRGNLREVEKQMGNKEFYIEVKYDGERMQVHKEGSKFQFFSRNGFDFTGDFGSSPREAPGKFCCHLADCLAPSVKSVILDGEICAYNHVTGSLCQKGEQMNIRSLQPDDPMFQQCLYVYDVVYLNGQVLTNKPLSERIPILESIVRPIEGRVEFAERKVGKSRAEVVDAVNLAIDRREEGIILKETDSVYRPAMRSRSGWVKIKPEYSNELMDQCDLIVMGGYYGSGKHGGIITHFLLGLEAARASADARREYHSFTRVGSGYSMKELNELLKKLQPNFKRGTPPADADFVYELGKEKPDVTIDPKHSVILQVKAAEIVSSAVYKVGCTLRFPRVEKVRHDKSFTDAMTVEEMETLRKQAEGKLTSRHFTLDDDEDDLDQEADEDFFAGDEDEDGEPARKRRRKRKANVTPRNKVARVPTQLRAIATDDIMVETHDLKGKVIVVEPANAKLKARLEAAVVKHGGKVEQNPSEGRTTCYVETGFKIKAKNVARSGKYDVVKSSWLVDCESEFRSLRPSDFMHMTEATEAKFADAYDEYGDGYTDRATAATLRHSMARVRELGHEIRMTHALKAEFESRFFAEGAFKLGMFRRCVVFAETSGDEFHPLALVTLKARFHGAKVVDSLEPAVTHVLLRPDDADAAEKLDSLKEVRRDRREKFHIVSDQWVERSLEGASCLPEKEFEL